MRRSNETRAEHAAAMCDEYGRLTHGKPDYDAPEDIATDLMLTFGERCRCLRRLFWKTAKKGQRLSRTLAL